MEITGFCLVADHLSKNKNKNKNKPVFMAIRNIELEYIVCAQQSTEQKKCPQSILAL